MYKSIIIVAVTWLFPLQTIASEYPTAPELLDKYAETQNKLKSFILKSQTSRKGESSTAARGKFSTDYSYDYELRFDGKRACIHRNMWGKPNATLNMTRDEALYQSKLWDGETYFNYHRSANSQRAPLGRVSISRIKQENNKRKTFKGCDRAFPGNFSRGYFPADTDRIDTILRKANTVSVRNETEKIGGADCYVIEANTKRGEYTVWIDPSHGYHIVKATAKRGAGDVVAPRNYKLSGPETRFFLLENVRFETIDDVWVPVEADLAYGSTYYSANSFDNTKIHQKVVDIILNPDHDALGSFVPDDIPDGAKADITGVPGIRYTWQNGKLIPNISKFAIETIDEMVGEFAKESKDPNGITNKAKPELVHITPTALLSKYRINQNKLRSFIAKGKSTIESTRTTGRSNKAEMQLSEFRFDGDRVCHRATILDDLVETKDKPIYKSFVWDGKSFITYRQGHKLKDNRAFVQNDDISNEMITTEYKGAALMGICGGDYVRIDSILGQAYKISSRDKRERVGGSECYVIDATTTRGQYTVWLDPKHGYNIAKVEVQRRKRNLVYNQARVKTSMSFSLDNVSFKQIDGIWVPMEADMQQTEDNQDKITKWHHKRTEMILNPDHDALGSFVADDIMDGTKTIFPRRFDTVEYIWQKGKAVLKAKSNVAR